MTDTNLADILDRPSSDIEGPKPPPVGSYLMTNTGIPRLDKTPKTGTQFYEFIFRPLQAMEDVDEQDLLAYLTKPDGSTKALADTEFKHRFYLTENSAFMFKNWLNDLEIGDGSMSLRQRAEESPGAQFIAHIKHTATDDGRIRAEISRFAKAE